MHAPPYHTGLDLRLDILDTGGSYVFPAMRTLAIKSADGFVLVCASDDPSSLEVSLHSLLYSLFLFDIRPRRINRRFP
jgi:GTPase SAR1 family protein